MDITPDLFKGKKIALLGEVEGDCLALLYQVVLDHLEEETVEDLVLVPGLSEDDYAEKEEALAYLPTPDILIFINGGYVSDLDLGIILAPYILEGCPCLVLGNTKVDVSHELVFTLNVREFKDRLAT